jgi:hypothetical protein
VPQDVGFSPAEYRLIINALVWFIVAGGSVFLAVVGWIGSQLLNQLQAISRGQKETNESLSNIEKDLRKDLAHLDRRMVRVEVKNNLQPLGRS